jgi:DNA-binding NtrC family response regulator
MLTQSEKVSYPILLVDDDHAALEAEAIALQIHNITPILTCADSRQVISVMKKHGCRILVLDIAMPYLSGMDLIDQIALEFPEAIIIMLTAFNDVEMAVNCLKKGAFDYIVKPIDSMRLATSVSKAIEHQTMREETCRLKESFLADSLQRPKAFEHIITNHKKILNLFRYIEAIASKNLPILISGETGVGKELFALAIHFLSGLTGEFVSVNCAGIDDQFLADALFGHKKGGFTGADGLRQGLISKARNGTLFLDEIGDMALASQVKLLRLLQEGCYYPIGSDNPVKSEVRFIAATNVDLPKALAQGRFRKDLYYRLQSHEIQIPPLRERKSDIPLLLDHFLRVAAEEMGKSKPLIPPQLFTILGNYHFPGNVRELQGMVYDAVSRDWTDSLSCHSFIEAIQKQRPDFTNKEGGRKEEEPWLLFPTPLPQMREVEIALVAEALKRSAGNKTLAAKMIGVSRLTLRKKMALKDFLP